MALPKPDVNRSQIIRDYIGAHPKSTIAEVVVALAEKGVEVTKNHVYVVKGKMDAKKLQLHSEKVVVSASDNGDAKPTSKSAAVRAVLMENRKSTAKEVVAALAEQGIEATEGLVYFVKGQMKGKRGRKKKTLELATPVALASVAESVSVNGDAVKTILKIKGWASEVGGLKKLKGLVDALSE